MILVLVIVGGLACFALGYYTCENRLKKKVDKFVADYSKFEDDDNPPGSL